MTERLSILIVEDNLGDSLLIKEYLSEKQNAVSEIMEAGTVETALNLLAENYFDIVLLDLFLPDSSGLDTVRRVITNYPEIPVIVLSNLQDEDVALQSVRYGAQDFLEKQVLSPITLYKSIIYSIQRMIILQEKEDLLHDLTQALNQIESLEGILPICVNCKKILDKDQRWLNIKDYIKHQSVAEKIPLVCPACRHDLD